MCMCMCVFFIYSFLFQMGMLGDMDVAVQLLSHFQFRVIKATPQVLPPPPIPSLFPILFPLLFPLPPPPPPFSFFPFSSLLLTETPRWRHHRYLRSSSPLLPSPLLPSSPPLLYPRQNQFWFFPRQNHQTTKTNQANSAGVLSIIRQRGFEFHWNSFISEFSDGVTGVVAWERRRRRRRREGGRKRGGERGGVYVCGVVFVLVYVVVSVGGWAWGFSFFFFSLSFFSFFSFFSFSFFSFSFSPLFNLLSLSFSPALSPISSLSFSSLSFSSLSFSSFPSPSHYPSFPLSPPLLFLFFLFPLTLH